MAKGTADASTIRGSYEIIDHTADIGICVSGATREELFARGAAAMFDLMVDLSGIDPTERVEIDLKGDSLEDLFVTWLNELIFRAEVGGIFFSRFEIDSVTDQSLKASVMGQIYEENVHLTGAQVKAATYHQLEISETQHGWTAKVIFDV